jgi:hypothetical protein
VNTQNARAALAFGNLFLTVAVLGLSAYVFDVAHYVTGKRREPPEDSRVPKYEPTKLALPTNVRAADPYSEYTVVWQQLDKPPPPPPPPPPPGPPQPTAEDLAARFRVTLVALATEGTSASYAILEPRSGGESVVITVNEQLPQPYQQYKCLSIEERADKKACVVTLEDQAHHPSPIILKEGEN